ncbi:MAG: YicC family protein [Clostridia bacterium]|nr:YicC family protein [Clostridia bacterium]MBQ3006847.1 YicC family protein [Clostridia bacterium]
MIKSMTGYGRAQQLEDGMNITVEIKSVNHRYFEFSSKLPRSYGFLDEKLKSFFSGKLTRGKMECYVQIEAVEEPDTVISLNHSLVKGYLDAYKELSETYGLENNIKVSDISRVSDIFTVRKQAADEDKIWNAVSVVAQSALDGFIAMREREGERLKADILSRLDEIIGNVEFIEARSPETVREYNEKLLGRLRELLADAHIEEQRILTEAAIFADKIAVAEETVRLRSHISQLRSFLEQSDAVGKKMDFLVQELNREANTIGSKAQDVEIARRVVSIKAEIEKIREQIQNIE